MICAFNECKSNCQEKLQIQNIWFNKNITYKGKPLFFPAWAKSGLIFVNDVINANGYVTLEEIKNTLKTTNNYLCEYITVKSALQKYASKTNLRDSAKRRHLKFVFNFQGHIKSIEGQKSSFFYSILLQQNSKKPNMESVWANIFLLDDTYVWENIYTEKIKKIFDKNVSEFNYKLLHNLITCNKYVSKWKTDLDKNCINCNLEEDVKHLIFDCYIFQPLWKKISEVLNVNVTWKIIVVGFPAYCNENTFVLNNVISFVAYKMYKYKMKCRVLSENVSYNGILFFEKCSYSVLPYNKIL